MAEMEGGGEEWWIGEEWRGSGVEWWRGSGVKWWRGRGALGIWIKIKDN